MFSFLTPQVPRVTVDELKLAVDSGEDMVLLDVRTPAEYEKARIAGSINIPLDDITKQIPSTVPDAQKRVYVYCLSGSRSAFAVDAMVKLGYGNVYDVQNGLLAWRGKHFPVLQ